MCGGGKGAKHFFIFSSFRGDGVSKLYFTSVGGEEGATFFSKHSPPKLPSRYFMTAPLARRFCKNCEILPFLYF